MGLRSIVLHLNSAQLSDLFFNYEHPERDKLYKITKENESIAEEDLQQALLNDAKNFCDVIGKGDDEVLIAELVKDFQHRV